MPKLREDSYFPNRLFELRRRPRVRSVEPSLRGVSTRRIEGLVRALEDRTDLQEPGLAVAKELDHQVEGLRNRPLDAGPEWRAVA